MTPAQKKACDDIRAAQVGSPILFEADNGAIVAVLTLGFGMTPGASWESKAYFPSDIDLQSVRIEADGTQTILGHATFVRDPRRLEVR